MWQNTTFKFQGQHTFHEHLSVSKFVPCSQVRLLKVEGNLRKASARLLNKWSNPRTLIYFGAIRAGNKANNCFSCHVGESHFEIYLLTRIQVGRHEFISGFMRLSPPHELISGFMGLSPPTHLSSLICRGHTDQPSKKSFDFEISTIHIGLIGLT